MCFSHLFAQIAFLESSIKFIICYFVDMENITDTFTEYFSFSWLKTKMIALV